MFDAARMALVLLLVGAGPAMSQAPAASADASSASRKSAASDQGTARKAGPLPGNGKDSNPEGRARIVGGDYGKEAQKTGASPASRSGAGAAGKSIVGTNANPPDGSGNKSFFESRSNTNPRTTSPIVNSGRAAGTVASP